MATKDESHFFGSIVEDLTQGRPYVFIIMDYKKDYPILEGIQKEVRESVGLECLRADDVDASGYDLQAKIHYLITRAELVIAMINTDSPNVYYELGYAVALQKPLLLLNTKGSKVQTDLQGLELIEYDDTKSGTKDFKESLKKHLRTRLESQIPLLRDMLEAPAPRPAYVVATPKIPLEGSRYRVPDERTFGDNLGILGLISAFGSIMFGETGIELISAKHFSPKLYKERLNLYLIGSSKSNPVTEKMLERLQKGCESSFTFGPKPGEKPVGDYPNVLYRGHKGNPKAEWIKGKILRRDKNGAIVQSVDHGIIVRGPHPDFPERLVMVLAGAHSLGTGAACLAATRSQLIRKIKATLPKGVDIADKHRTLWVLVQAINNEQDAHLDVENVKILEAGVYDNEQQTR